MGGISYKLLVEFRQIYNVGAVGDKDDLVWFHSWLDFSVKGRGHNEIRYGKKLLV